MSAICTRLLRVTVTAAALTAPGLALACNFYRTADTRLEIFDLPITGSGLAIAVLPEGASACIIETRTDNAGNGWDKIDFFMHENVRYGAAGWLKAAADGTAATEAPGEVDTGAAAAMPAKPAMAEGAGSKEAFFASDWTLAPAQSAISFLSTKKGSVTEVHRFTTLSGQIGADGSAEVTIDLESVETGVDIRNVRMRFLLFQIDTFAQAKITAQIDPAALDALWDDRRVTMDLPLTLSLHGIEQVLDVPVTIARLGPAMVSVRSAQPLVIEASDFGLEGGITQLSEAVGNIGISTEVPVTFDLTFTAVQGG